MFLTSEIIKVTFSTVSIIGWIVIAILVMAEVNNYFTPRFKEHMVVDTSLGQLLRVNLNITFHALTCNEVVFCLKKIKTINSSFKLGSFGCNGCSW
jgi:hypothetical protein